jgi:hypothetical protein
MSWSWSRSIFHILGDATIALAVGAGLSSCASADVMSLRTARVGPEVTPESSVVILRVMNYEWYDVAVLLDAGDNVRKRVGTVTGTKWSFFVLTSTVLGAVNEFVVVLVPVGQAVVTFRSHRIRCIPGKLVLVTISMGGTPEPAKYLSNVIAASLP